MEVIGFLVAVALLVAAVVILGNIFGWWERGAGNGDSSVNKESASLVVTPDMLCPTSGCSASVAFSTTTEAENASATLSVVTPAGRTVDLASSLNGELTFAGDDPIFSDGSGVYNFRFEATNLQGEDLTRRDTVTLMARHGTTLPYTSSVQFSANSTEYERMSALDVLVLGEGDFGKGHHRFTFCNKSTVLAGIHYGSGGVAGYSDALSVTVYNLRTGAAHAAAIMNPGDDLIVDPAISIADSAAVEMIMTAYTDGVGAAANSFPIGSTVQWSIYPKLDCQS